jgi:uncharacterized protein YndB with AHSA1/START domain
MNRSVRHTSFSLEREFDATPDRVFAAWSDPEKKRRWTACDPATTERVHELDFRPGGLETTRITTPDGVTRRIVAYYFDIVPGERIVYAYDIVVEEDRISTSLVTVAFAPSPTGTQMVFTEQVALLDGHDGLEERIHGTQEGLQRLALEILSEDRAH